MLKKARGFLYIPTVFTQNNLKFITGDEQNGFIMARNLRNASVS